MKHYINVYKCLFGLNFSLLFAFRATLFNNIISSTLWTIFPMITMILLTSRSKYFYNWSSDELYLLTAYFTFFIGLFYTLFGRSFRRFSTLIQFGQLDSLLLKPIDSQFLISFWHVNFTNVIRVIVGVILLLVMSNRLHLHISLLSFLLFLFFTFAGIILLYAIWFMVMTITVWFAQLTNLRDLLITFNSISRYPPEMFHNIFLFVICLPLTVIIATPTKVLLQKVSLFDITALLMISVTSFYLSRIFWKFALRYYTSASG